MSKIFICLNCTNCKGEKAIRVKPHFRSCNTNSESLYYCIKPLIIKLQRGALNQRKVSARCRYLNIEWFNAFGVEGWEITFRDDLNPDRVKMVLSMARIKNPNTILYANFEPFSDKTIEMMGKDWHFNKAIKMRDKNG